ncbi:MAG: ATP-dependent DNA helicase [Candidatus ainarchaeum sp.]|nr:ATP-dependent DNA helicase [Candidatus ainarchaeum sp.]
MSSYFPYEKIRDEQNQLINDISKSVENRKCILCHAPTGLGKTISSVAPAIEYAIKNKKVVFFLTPKIAQHEIVLKTVKEINKKFQTDIRAIDLVGKKGMCIDPMLSNFEFGFYDACKRKRKEGKCRFYINTKGKTQKQKEIAKRKKRDVIEMYNHGYTDMKDICQTNELCPYEITLEMSKKANLIIADYSHLFDDEIRTSILNNAKVKMEDIILIVDEAHNLNERIRKMFSNTLNVEMIENAKKEARSIGEMGSEITLSDMEKEILSLGKNLSFDKIEQKIEKNKLEFIKKVTKENLEELKESAFKYMTRRKIESCTLLTVCEFIENMLNEKEHFLHIVERKKTIGLRITPLDASEYASKVINNTFSTVLMSGTLTPTQMYADLLGVVESKRELKEYKSPFDQKNRLNIIVEKTTTKYTDRNNEQFNEIAQIINQIIPKIPGNTIVFFPSFELLETLATKINSSRKIIKQEREMNSEERENLIHKFKLLGEGFGGVLLAVSGGSIAEGIDFPGENLFGAIIVGIPFGRVNTETTELIKYYDLKYKKGWDYAYNGPAINKAIQASGRVIRTETDKGVSVFLDMRFGEDRYKKFYPKDFRPEKLKEIEEIKKRIDEFFK